MYFMPAPTVGWACAQKHKECEPKDPATHDAVMGKES